MEDREIVELFMKRDEQALSEVENKYGERCKALSMRILNSKEDSEEAVNDTLLKAWNSIPPNIPPNLFSYLATLCRRTSIDILKKRTTKKRGGNEYELSVEELDYCIPDNLRQNEMDFFVLEETLNDFLKKLPEKKRIIFMRRYWWLNSVSEIAENMNMKESNVKMTLLRLRKKLKEQFENEGINL